MSTHRPYHCLAYLILVIFVAACQSVPMGATLPKPAATSIATLPVSPTPTLVPIPTLPNPPDPRVAPPNQTNREGYLVRRVPGIPDVKIVDKDQSKLEFANTLEIEQLDSLAFVSIKAKREAKLKLLGLLDRTNPGLPDNIKPGTLVVIPSLNVDRLSGITQYRSSVSEPLLLIVPVAMSLAKVAQKFHVPLERLSAANPELGDLTQIPASSVLIIPAQ